MTDPQTSQAFDPPSVRQVEFERRYPTPLLVVALEDAASLNAYLRDLVLQRASRDPGVALSNAGGWQSTADFADWSGSAGAYLLGLAVDIANSATAVLTEEGLQGGGPAWRVNAWANVNGHGHANRPHHHPAAFWSGVYWIDAGQAHADDAVGGEFEMHDPRGILPAFYAPRLRYALPGCLSAGAEDFFTPRTGTMLIFPSWLVHAVRAYTGQALRISVAFNLSV